MEPCVSSHFTFVTHILIARINMNFILLPFSRDVKLKKVGPQQLVFTEY